MHYFYGLLYAFSALPLVILLWSLLLPTKSIWPLKHANTVSLTMAWVITILAFSAGFILGIMNWNAFGWPSWLRFWGGGGLVLLGNLLAFAGLAQIGTKATSGGKSELIETGLYQYSRNPQYLGDVLILIGWLVLSASVLALPAILVLMLAAILAPFTEEPWLRQVYGTVYDRYKAGTARFFVCL